MVLEDDGRSQSDSDIENGRKYSTGSSESDRDLNTVLIAPKTLLSATHIMENKTSKKSDMDQSSFNEIPKDDNSKQIKCDSENQQKEQKRKISAHSLVGNAQIHLQLFVEDVKVELKELTQKSNSKTVDNRNQDENGNEKPIDENEKGEEANSGKQKKERKGWQRYLGIILAITSSMMFALAILIVKTMSNYDPYSVSVWRFQGILLPALPIAFYYRGLKKQNIFKTVWPPKAKGHPKTIFFLFLRGVSGASAVVLQFYSLQFMSMADSSVIAFSTPVFVSLASHWLLGEKSGFIPVLCGIITLGGVVVITRPPMLTGGEGFDTQTLIGAGLALGCMFCAASTFLLLRYLRQMHFSVITAYFGVWGTLQSLALALIFSEFQIPRNTHDWLLASAIALLTFVGQTCITLAFKYEQAAIISLCRTCDILFAYLWQFVFLGEIPDLFSMIGGFIVIFGVFLAALRKFISELPEDSQAKKRLWILLL